MSRKEGLEASVLEVLWNAEGEWLTPREVRERLDYREVAYTTVMTTLVRLVRKGQVERRKMGRAFGYAPTADRETSVARRMEEILDASGDRSAALARFLGSLPQRDRRAARRALEE